MAEKMWTNPGWSPRLARISLIRASLRKALSLRINAICNPASVASRSAFARSSSRKGLAQLG